MAENILPESNEQIDNTSYYSLPSGRFLEDFILEEGLNFAEGSALKYLWRAGHKKGESKEKDLAKFDHYCRYLCRMHNKGFGPQPEYETVRARFREYVHKARTWDGRMWSPPCCRS